MPGKLTVRGVRGDFQLNKDKFFAESWAAKIAHDFNSNQDTETYEIAGATNGYREKKGGYQKRKFRVDEWQVKNKKYENTLAIETLYFNRDKTQIITDKIFQFSLEAALHPQELLTELIEGGFDTVCFDDQFFFDTDHVLGNSGTQDNDLTNDISTLPVNQVGSTTFPSPEVMELLILLTVQQILGFKNDVGKSRNVNLRGFLIMVPVAYWSSAVAAVNNMTLTSGKTNTITGLKDKGFKFQVEPNPELTWTDKFATFAWDGIGKSFILQHEIRDRLSILDIGSEHEKKEDEVLYISKARRRGAYGDPLMACAMTLT